MAEARTQVATATLLIIGDELLAGEIADKNGPYLAEQLSARGLRVAELRVLPDHTDTIAHAVRTALAQSDLVLMCGGLGPTSDDRTTEAVAQALGRPTVHDEAAWEHIRAIFGVRDAEPPPGNRKQAQIPEGAEVLPNHWGTAPGFVAREGAGRVAVLPGPPRENRPMFTEVLWPLLAAEAEADGRDTPLLTTRVFRVFGLPESTVGERLRTLEASYPQIRVGYQARLPEILVKLRLDSTQTAAGDAAAADLYKALAPYLYGEGETTLPEVLGRTLEAQGKKLVTAESCTGGLAAKLVTDIPGSSAWMDRGFVTYSNASKTELLGVPEPLLAEHGAVSEPVARAMLAGALERSDAQVGLAITGIAGPTGGTAEKPVGTIWLAWGDAKDPQARRILYPFNRDFNRTVGAWAALGQLYRFVRER